MIADDRDAIREAMDKLAWKKRIGEAEARVLAGATKVDPVPDPKPLLDEPGAPYLGRFLSDLPCNGNLP